jgi:hypothetical protein
VCNQTDLRGHNTETNIIIGKEKINFDVQIMIVVAHATTNG